MPVRVLIAAEHAIVREAISHLLAADAEISIVGYAHSGPEALELIQAHHPEIVLVDSNLSSTNPIEFTSLISEQAPETGIILLFTSGTFDDILDAVHAGARGFASRDTDSEGLIQQIKRVASGGVSLPDQLITQLVERLAHRSGYRLGQREPTLTQQERRVLSFVARGMSNKEIADRLNISQNTVRAHIRSLMQKLQQENRTQLAIYALRHGGLEGPEA